MMEAALTWLLAAIGIYFVGAFLLSALVVGCGLYFVWKLMKGG